ncbi:hypothetical protein AB0O72_31445 [Streptomyces sp. NPDC088106]|uniref:hypothetical protein n=1 Tax=Streptomyces sp. NPDC088106 TaxID=3154867 RepID=UPI0034427B36
MTVRSAVRQFSELGPLPSEDDVTDGELEQFDHLLESIIAPVTAEEAELLAESFGDDNCFGLAWSLLHLIETSPVHPISAEPAATANEWVRRLWERRSQAAD